MSIALVTGAARGLGRAIGDSLLKSPDVKAVVYADILSRTQFASPDPEYQMKQKRQIFVDGIDVSQPDSVAEMFDRAEEELKHSPDTGSGAGGLNACFTPNVVVCNAGILFPTRILDISAEEWKKVHEVNTHGVFYTLQTGLKRMMMQIDEARNAAGAPNSQSSTDSNSGTTPLSPLSAPDSKQVMQNDDPNHPLNLPYRVITTASSAGRSVSTLGGAHYTASKAAVIGLTRAAAKEMGPKAFPDSTCVTDSMLAKSVKYGITVNAICPGLIRSAMSTDTVQNYAKTFAKEGGEVDGDAVIRQYEKSFPANRLGEPWEIGSLVRFLASRDASYITGACIDINGGDLML